MSRFLSAFVSAVLAMATPPRPVAAPPASPPQPVRAAPTLTAREKLLKAATAEIGTQEKTGNNDGPVDKYLAAVGLGKTRNPYCAAFVYWAGKQSLGASNPFPKSAWSPDFVAGGTTDTASAKPGDTFGIYFAAKGRVAHTGLIKGKQGRYLVTVEANTSPSATSGTAADRDGDGVWSKLRDPRTIHRTKSWLP